jgi:glycosyltransferase involved in cell wall biosynthesis
MISIIIPTLNEEKYIEATLESIKNQNFKDFEVIVCDCHSNDKTIEIAKKYTDKIVFTETRSTASARNTGAKYASGEYLVFLDADTMLSCDYLEKAHDIFKKAKYVGFCGAFKFSNKSLRYKITENAVNLAYIIFDLFRKTAIPGFNFCIPKSIFEKVGGFENVFVEDIDLFKKLGKLGKTKYFTHLCVITSSRRLERQGILKTLDYYYDVGRKYGSAMDFSKRYIKVD